MGVISSSSRSTTAVVCGQTFSHYPTCKATLAELRPAGIMQRMSSTIITRLLSRFYTASTALFITLTMGVVACPKQANAAPQKGSLELRFPGGQLLGTGLPSGILYRAPEVGENSTLVHVGAGLGYFVNDNLEVGATVGLIWTKTGGGDSASGPVFSPFLRGFFMVTPRLALFAEGNFDYLHLSQGDSSTTATGFGADAGAEFFLADSWAIRVAPGFRHWNTETSGSTFGFEQSSDALGIGWGIAAYF